MNSATVPKRLRIDVSSALHAICSTGKGCCWFCDAKLPAESEAVKTGWDVQRVDDHPVATIILVCPNCVNQPCDPLEHRKALESVSMTAMPTPRRSRSRRGAIAQ
ncbi:MAG: hypothetical protein ACRD22_07460 [Terriglobia bacterium]